MPPLILRVSTAAQRITDHGITMSSTAGLQCSDPLTLDEKSTAGPFTPDGFLL